MKPSCDWPNTLPLALATPITVNGRPFDLDFFADGIRVCKKVALHIGADDGYHGAVPVLNFGKVTAGRDFRVAQRRPVGRASV